MNDLGKVLCFKFRVFRVTDLNMKMQLKILTDASGARRFSRMCQMLTYRSMSRNVAFINILAHDVKLIMLRTLDRKAKIFFGI